METRTKQFSQVKEGDILFTLERSKRLLYPLFDMVKVIKVGSEKTSSIPTEKDYIFKRVVDLLVIDQDGNQYEISLESAKDESIYDKVYYTTNPEFVVKEVTLCKHSLDSVISNINRYKAASDECGKILDYLQQGQVNNIPQSPTEINIKSIIQEEVKKAMQGIQPTLDSTKEMMEKIHNELFPNKTESTNQ